MLRVWLEILLLHRKKAHGIRPYAGLTWVRPPIIEIRNENLMPGDGVMNGIDVQDQALRGKSVHNLIDRCRRGRHRQAIRERSATQRCPALGEDHVVVVNPDVLRFRSGSKCRGTECDKTCSQTDNCGDSKESQSCHNG